MYPCKKGSLLLDHLHRGSLAVLTRSGSATAMRRATINVRPRRITTSLVHFVPRRLLLGRSATTTTTTTRTRSLSFLDSIRLKYRRLDGRGHYNGACSFATQTDGPRSDNEDDDKNTTATTKQTTTTTPTLDPPIWTWIDNFVPSGWKPYARLARLDKPIGTWLLLWPCCWSTALAHPASLGNHLSLVALFALGAFTMRGAGCTINDLCDQDIDQAVQRTQRRPLAAGDLTRTQAVQFLALQLATGCVVLVSLPHTWYCFQWGVASLPLVFIYPTTKRYFPYPQFVLGLCFNWGAWMGWAATYGSMDWATVAPLYLSGVTWTLVYDTLYAHQDKMDDRKLGLYSTALTFGTDERVQRQILHSLAATTYLLWATAGYQVGVVNPALFGAGITAAYGHLVWQIQTADFVNPHNLAARFRSNAITGALVYGALLAGNPPTVL